MRDHLIPGLGQVPLTKLTPQHVARWFHVLGTNGASARTIRYARAVLRAALNQALRWELVSRNAAALTDPPKYRAREIQPLSVRQTLERSGGDAAARKRVGAERRRLLGKRHETTDRAARRRLTTALDEIRQQSKAVQSTLHVSEPKTARSRRTITLPSLVSDALRAHRTRQLEDRLAAGGRWIDSGMVFTSTVGTLMEPRTMQRKFKAILRTAELPNIRYHDLRHTAATLLLAQGVDPRTIMETLGHSQISMTLNTYAHVVPALRRVAAEKMDAILNG